MGYLIKSKAQNASDLHTQTGTSKSDIVKKSDSSQEENALTYHT
jgi:hypothetical protein